jgi:hypothetical protein
MEHMVLVLKPSATQQAALDALLEQQQDRSSANYHHWLTPEDFGTHFGVSLSDINQTENWLRMHGFTVEEVPASRRSIIFSGTAAQVSVAFQTSMRRYVVNGKSHYANSGDPSIPQALAGVIGGVLSLHNFESAPSHMSDGAKADFTAGNGAHYLAPVDWDTIYDVNPLIASGLTGSGESIAIVGRVDITLNDVSTFRSQFGLPANQPQVIVNGADPGTNSDDQMESMLDVEWSGAIAQNATVKFVTSASGASDGVSLSAQYAVTHNVAPIISVSYGSCEAAMGSGGNQFWNSLWQQAASQGISVFVSSGDSGAAGCDSSSSTAGSHGRGVNGLCSSPYSTCVGGTEFNDTSNPSQYWASGSNSNWSSALGYIPEAVWNESSSSSGLWASGGGVSTVYPKPAWQVAPGVPADGMRDVPDVAMAAAMHDSYLVQMQGSTYLVGGTSAAAPSFASLMALVLQRATVAQGNINPTLYQLATQQNAAGGVAVFHAITTGNNSVPGVTGFNAGAGYDQATGLGSVDGSVLVNEWVAASGVNFALTPSVNSLTVTDTTTGNLTLTLAPHGGFSSSVALTASGAPTGVTITYAPATLTTAAPVKATFTVAATAVPGTYPISFSGSAAGLTETTSVSLVVLPPSFNLTESVASINVARGSSAAVTYTSTLMTGFNSALTLSASGAPTGVTATFAPASIASPGSGSSKLTLAASSSPTPGVYPITVSATGNGITKTQTVNLTVLTPNFTLTASSASPSVAPGGSVPVTLSTAISNGFSSAVVLSVSGAPTGVAATLATSSLVAPGSGSSKLTLAAASSTAPGTYALTVTASGANVTHTQTINLTVLTPSFTLTSPATASVAPGGTATVSISTALVNGFSSAVALSVTGVPNGVTPAFSLATIASPGSGSSKLTLTAAPASRITPGVYVLTISATGAGITKPHALSLTVLTPSFTLTASPATTSIAPSGTSSVTLTTSLVNGFNASVALSASGLPDGVTAAFSTSTIAAPGNGTSNLTLTASGTAVPKAYSFRVTATGANVTKTQTMTLTVLTPSFTIAANTLKPSATVGGSGSVTLTAGLVNGFNSAVTLSVGTLPAGVTASFSPASIAAPGNGTSTLTLSAASGTAVKTYSVTITATGGGVTKTQAIVLNVLATANQ